MRAVERRKGLSGKRQEGSDIYVPCHFRLASLFPSLLLSPASLCSHLANITHHLFKCLPYVLWLNSAISSSPCSHFHITGPHLCHITPIFRQLSSLILRLRILFNLPSFYSHTYICITSFFSFSPLLIPSSPPPYTPLVCLAWIPADDGTHKASQMRR